MGNVLRTLERNSRKEKEDWNPKYRNASGHMAKELRLAEPKALDPVFLLLKL